MSVRSLWVVHARGEGFGRYRGGSVGCAHVVGVVWPWPAVRGCGRTPSEAVDFVVVGVAVIEVRVVEVAYE